MSNYRYKKLISLDKRLKIVEQQYKKKPEYIVLVVQKDPKCIFFPDLSKNSFSIHKSQKLIEIHHAIRKRIISIDKKYENQSLFIFSLKRIPNKETSIGQLYEKEKDGEDGLLYLFYSNMQPFGYS